VLLVCLLFKIRLALIINTMFLPRSDLTEKKQFKYKNLNYRKQIARQQRTQYVEGIVTKVSDSSAKVTEELVQMVDDA